MIMSDNTPNPKDNPAEPATDGSQDQTGSTGQAGSEAQADNGGAQEAVFKAADPAPRIEPDSDTPDGGAASPKTPVAAPAVDQRAYEQYQVLATTVLESAENATRSAQAAADASRDLRQTSKTVMELGQANHKRNTIMLAAAGGLMLLSLIFFMIMGVRMISRINQLDAMVLAVGKRAVELGVSLESLSSVQESMQDLAGKQNELKKAQAQFESRIENSLKQSESIAQKVPQETAKQVAASSDTMLKQVKDINQRLSSQTSAVQKLGSEINALKTATANVDTLKRDVEALITLQRERYLETVQKTNQTQQRERAVQYPRRDGKPIEPTPRQQ
jgi:DNA repair exonuclease SbcCD ATPase subunit